jgi:hypothetical protein
MEAAGSNVVKTILMMFLSGASVWFLIGCNSTTEPKNGNSDPEGIIVFSARETPESNSQLYTMLADD